MHRQFGVGSLDNGSQDVAGPRISFRGHGTRGESQVETAFFPFFEKGKLREKIPHLRSRLGIFPPDKPWCPFLYLRVFLLKY